MRTELLVVFLLPALAQVTLQGKRTPPFGKCSVLTS